MIRCYCFLLLFLFLSCRQSQKKEVFPEKMEPPTERLLSDFLIYSNDLLQADSSLSSHNVNFGPQGFLLGDSKQPSYIEIPFNDLDLSKPFNISFSYKTTSSDGSKPQSLLTFADQFTTPSSAPCYIYLAGRRITMAYDRQLLWAEDYDKSKGESRKYYDSYPLEHDVFYFVSVNFTGDSIAIFVNSELYSSFDSLIAHNREFTSLYIGGVLNNNQITYPLFGSIHGLKLFKKALTPKEIAVVYNDQPYL